MIVRRFSLRLSMIGALASCIAIAWSVHAADPSPADSPCQKLTGADRTECERRVREQEQERAAPPRPDQNEPPPDTESEGNDDSDTADPPQP